MKAETMAQRFLGDLMANPLFDGLTFPPELQRSIIEINEKTRTITINGPVLKSDEAKAQIVELIHRAFPGLPI